MPSDLSYKGKFGIIMSVVRSMEALTDKGLCVTLQLSGLGYPSRRSAHLHGAPMLFRPVFSQILTHPPALEMPRVHSLKDGPYHHHKISS